MRINLVFSENYSARQVAIIKNYQLNDNEVFNFLIKKALKLLHFIKDDFFEYHV